MSDDGFDLDVPGLQAIIEAMPERVILLDLDGYIRYLSRTDKYKQEDFLGTHAHELLPPDSREVYDVAFEAVVETGELQEYDVELVLPDGETAWYRTRMLPFPSAGALTGVLLISEDITELKEKEAELTELRQLLPVCAWCGRIKEDDGQWSTIEDYMKRRGDTTVSHAICPDCSDRVSQPGTSASGDDVA